MTLIISERGRNARRLEPQTLEREDYLQRYIYENPEAKLVPGAGDWLGAINPESRLRPSSHHHFRSIR